MEQYPGWVTIIVTGVQKGYRNFGILLCYLALLLVAAFSTLSLISIMYMAIVLLCFLIHYLHPNPHHHLRRIWLPIVIFNGLVLIAKYMYLFPPIQTFLNDNYDGNDCIFFFYFPSPLFLSMFSITLRII
jgi:hypothetical protein